MKFQHTNLIFMRSVFRGLTRNRMNPQRKSKPNRAIDKKLPITSQCQVLIRDMTAAEAEQLLCRQRIAAGEARAAFTPFVRSHRSAAHGYDHHQRRD